MSTAALNDKALLEAPDAPSTPAAPVMVDVARKYRVSPFRQLRESIALSLGRPKIKLHEYYSVGLFDPELSMEEKKQFVGNTCSKRINDELSPRKLTLMRAFASDKALFTALIRQLGFGTTETQAVVSAIAKFGSIPTFRRAEEVRAFLTGPARFPLFGKPQDFSGSFGSVLIQGLEGEDLLLGNGGRVPLDTFCNEVIEQYRSGYMFQTALEQHDDLRAVTGDAVGSLRIVTVRENPDPYALYAAWKIPAPDAMSDNFWQSGSMIAPIDVETGVVGQGRAGTGIEARDVDVHPVSGAQITGMQLPMWHAAVDMAQEVHAVLPEFGCIGWDVAITPDGPMIIECNSNPFHTLYQLSHCRGIRNPDFEPVFDRVAAYSQEMLAERIARNKKRWQQYKGKKSD